MNDSESNPKTKTKGTGFTWEEKQKQRLPGMGGFPVPHTTPLKVSGPCWWLTSSYPYKPAGNDAYAMLGKVLKHRGCLGLTSELVVGSMDVLEVESYGEAPVLSNQPWILEGSRLTGRENGCFSCSSLPSPYLSIEWEHLPVLIRSVSCGNDTLISPHLLNN